MKSVRKKSSLSRNQNGPYASSRSTQGTCQPPKKSVTVRPERTIRFTYSAIWKRPHLMPEYSGMRWGLFQMAEYVNLIVLSGLTVTLFFGGWHVPWVERLDAYGPFWFLLKLLVLLTVFIWIRASVPRLRYDQLMRFGWKILLPAATINALVTAFLVVLI